MVGLIDFSTDAASNDMAAPPILWVEGQPAKTINDSMRATMAALANWRDDNVGALGASRGGGDVYTVATSARFPGCVRCAASYPAFPCCLGEPDPGLPLSRRDCPPSRSCAPGDARAGPATWLPIPSTRCPTSPARARISSPRLRSSGPAGLSPRRMPRWSRDGFPVMDAPSRGQPYSALFAVIGTTWGNGDGTTTFNIPDLRGRAMFGADNLGGTAANVLTGTGGAAGINGALGSSGGAQSVTLTTAQMPSHPHPGNTNEAGSARPRGQHRERRRSRSWRRIGQRG